MDDLAGQRPPLKTDELLKGVVAVVDCRSEGEDRSVAVAHQLQLLGAVVSRHFNKKVTHAVFHEGKQSTYDQAKKLAIPMMSIGWIEGCLQMGSQAPEHLFKARIDACYEDPLVRPKNFRCARPWDFVMSPELSAARMRRNRRQREQRERRRRLLDPRYASSEDAGSSSMDSDCRWMRDPPRINPTLILYDMSSDEDERDDTVPPPLTHRLLQKFPDSPILLEAYQRRERLKAEAAASAAAMATSAAAVDETSSSSPPSLATLLFNSEASNEALTSGDSKMPKRDRAHAFSTSESEGESRLRIGRDEREVAMVNSNDSIEDFQVVRKHRSKAKRLIFPSKLAATLSSLSSFDEMVLTSFELNEKKAMVLMIRQLGRFRVKSRVTDRTSHVICRNGRRTLSALHGSVRGCWLLSPQWISMSFKTGRWIDEAPYELFDQFPTAQIYRLKRANLSTAYRCDIFAEAGSIFVRHDTSVPLKDLKALLVQSGAQIVESAAEANVVIGGIGNVGSLWVFDSITKHEVLPLEEYRINS